MDLREIARLRLRNQRLVSAGGGGAGGAGGAKFKSAAEVVGWLVCVQAQEYALARWSVGLRTRRLVEAEVESEVAAGRILRTHVLRPTWHFILPRDIRWVVRLTAPRFNPMVTRRHGQLGLEPRDVTRALDAIGRALAGGVHLTRQELGAAIERGGVSVDGQRLAFIVMAAECALVVASGKPKDASQTYGLLDELAPVSGAAHFDRDHALAELTLRYFTGHGPATVGDFAWWSSLTVADARRGLAANGSALERLTVDGTDYWWAGDSTSGQDDRSPTIHLLQGYDEYVVAYRAPRDPINIERLASPSGLSRPPFLHALVLDGQLIGWWRRVTLREGFGIETRLLRDLSAREKSALDSEVDAYGRFVGRPVNLIGPEIAARR